MYIINQDFYVRMNKSENLLPLLRWQSLLLDILLEPFLEKEFMLSDPFTLQCFNRFIRKETDPFFLIWIDKYKVNYLLNQQ